MLIQFTCEDKVYLCSTKAKFLVETANGSSSYTLERGFSQPSEAVQFYSELVVGGSKKKRLTMIDAGKSLVLARQ